MADNGRITKGDRERIWDLETWRAVTDKELDVSTEWRDGQTKKTEKLDDRLRHVELFVAVFKAIGGLTMLALGILKVLGKL